MAPSRNTTIAAVSVVSPLPPSLDRAVTKYPATMKAPTMRSAAARIPGEDRFFERKPAAAPSRARHHRSA
jgi:hypothetical protein